MKVTGSSAAADAEIGSASDGELRRVQYCLSLRDRLPITDDTPVGSAPIHRDHAAESR